MANATDTSGKLTTVLDRLDRVHPTGGGYSARCPAHDDNKASLMVRAGRDHPVLLHCHAGCPTDAIVAALNLTTNDLSNPRRDAQQDRRWMPCMTDHNTRRPNPGHEVAAEYLYRDPATKGVVRGVTRCARKCFRQWRPDPTRKNGRTWTTRLPDGTEVGADLIYRLPELLANQTQPYMERRNVWIVEGEKDADRLWTLGYPATTNPQGAGKWTPAHAAWLTGDDITIVADNDKAGAEHTQKVAVSLVGIARSIDVVRAAFGKDVSDHLDEHGPHVTEWLTANGFHAVDHDNGGQPLDRLSVHHLVTVAAAIPAPTHVPGCPDCQAEQAVVRA